MFFYLAIAPVFWANSTWLWAKFPLWAEPLCSKEINLNIGSKQPVERGGKNNILLQHRPPLKTRLPPDRLLVILSLFIQKKKKKL